MIYQVTRTDWCDYDEHDALVVRAGSEAEAREIALAEDVDPFGDADPRYTGFTASNIVIEKVAAAGPSGVIVASFNAG